MASAATILTGLWDLAAPAAITPAQRWASARPTRFGSANYQMLYLLVLGLLAAAAAIVVALIVRRWLVGRRRLQQEFREHCEHAGLGKEEINLLSFAAQLGGLRAPVNIAVTEAVFHRCMYLLVACERVAAMSLTDKDRILSVINSSQIKLGFDESTSLAGDRQITEGSNITITGAGVLEPVQATVIRSQGWELKAQAAPQQESLPTNVPLRAKYYCSGAVWEFDTSLIYADGRDLTFAHPGRIRFLNRRRFRRAHVSRPALIASYSFLKAEPLAEPVFHPARLVELGATGLVLEVEDMPSLPNKAKLLVILDLRPGRTVNGIGIVLRNELITSRRIKLVVELTDLSESHISELVSETNLADQQSRAGEAPDRAERAKSAGSAQPAWRP